MTNKIPNRKMEFKGVTGLEVKIYPKAINIAGVDLILWEDKINELANAIQLLIVEGSEIGVETKEFWESEF